MHMYESCLQLHFLTGRSYSFGCLIDLCSKKIKGCTEEKEPSWGGGAINWLVDLILNQHNPASSVPSLCPVSTLNLTDASSLAPCGLKITGLCIGMDLYNFLDCFEKDVKLFVGRALESCKEGIQCRVSLFAYFTWRQSSDGLLDRTALPTDVCRCNRVHSRQTHAVTFWLCSSIVVAILVTFLKITRFFENTDID